MVFDGCFHVKKDKTPQVHIFVTWLTSVENQPLLSYTRSKFVPQFLALDSYRIGAFLVFFLGSLLSNGRGATILTICFFVSQCVFLNHGIWVTDVFISLDNSVPNTL